MTCAQEWQKYNLTKNCVETVLGHFATNWFVQQVKYKIQDIKNIYDPHKIPFLWSPDGVFLQKWDSKITFPSQIALWRRNRKLSWKSIFFAEWWIDKFLSWWIFFAFSYEWGCHSRSGNLIVLCLRNSMLFFTRTWFCMTQKCL